MKLFLHFLFLAIALAFLARAIWTRWAGNSLECYAWWLGAVVTYLVSFFIGLPPKKPSDQIHP